MTAEVLLSRCEKVRGTGHGKWIASCPAHEDRSPSLAIKDESDGRVLLHCFAGCEPQDVLNAIGLTFSDVMPERIGNDHSLKPQKWINAKEALATLDHESLVVSVIGSDFLQHEEIDDDTWSRLAIAVDRINTTRAKYAAARVSR